MTISRFPTISAFEDKVFLDSSDFLRFAYLKIARGARFLSFI